MMIKKVLIAGGSGLIGRKLTQHLLASNYDVHWLSRNPSQNSSIKQYYWNPSESSIDKAALEEADIVVNLSGAGIADKLWTPARKRVLVESRIQPIQLLHKTFKDLNIWPQKFISASAVGFYGNRPFELLNESALKGSGFLCYLTAEWEKAIDLFSHENIPTTKLRIGIVLSNDGGSFPLFKRISNLPVLILPGGKQMTPWIHMDDLVSIIVDAIQNDNLKGIVNCSAPNPVSLKNLFEELCKVDEKRKLIIGFPTLPVKVIAGKISEIILNNQNVVPQKLLETGYAWKYPKIKDALRDLL